MGTTTKDARSTRRKDQPNFMPIDTVRLAEITEGRQKTMAASIRTISMEELKTLGDRLFPCVDHPWRDKFFTFLTENTGAHVLSRDRARRRASHLLSLAGQEDVVHAGEPASARCRRRGGRFLSRSSKTAEQSFRRTTNNKKPNHDKETYLTTEPFPNGTWPGRWRLCSNRRFAARTLRLRDASAFAIKRRPFRQGGRES